MTKINTWHIEDGYTATFGPTDFESWWLAGMTREDKIKKQDQAELYENCLYLAEAEQRKMMQSASELRLSINEWANQWNKKIDTSNAASALGRIKSERKAASSRENGKKGGRPTEKKTYWILSGEGENGTWEKHIATLTGIKRIATKERCGGDRWAQIWEEIPETDTTEAHICNIDDGDMRDVPDED